MPNNEKALSNSGQTGITQRFALTVIGVANRDANRETGRIYDTKEGSRAFHTEVTEG